MLPLLPALNGVVQAAKDATTNAQEGIYSTELLNSKGDSLSILYFRELMLATEAINQ